MAEGDAFNLVRAKALNTYADLEQMLAMLFSKLLDADDAKSYIVFSSIINYRSRRELLTRLMHKTYGDKYKAFFKSLMGRLATIESERNKVVHWIVLTSHRGKKQVDPETDVNLHEHPNIYAGGTISKKQLEEFTERTDFIRLIVYYFVLYLKFGAAMVKNGAWRRIFQQQVRYPPQKDHPLSLMRKEPSGQPQSSGP